MDVLFDSGCAHSFISSQLVKNLGVQASLLSKSFRVTIGTGDCEVTKLEVTNISLDIQEKPYVWNFIMYEVKGH